MKVDGDDERRYQPPSKAWMIFLYASGVVFLVFVVIAAIIQILHS